MLGPGESVPDVTEGLTSVADLPKPRIEPSTNDIVAFQLSNSFVGLDHLTYSRVGGSGPAVPEPSSLMLGAMALAGLQAYRWVRCKPRKT